jgi:spore coat polysaccharide biosynthesis predicted glycosyltransferase SpsG
MNIGFRLDFTKKSGSGHFFRCLRLAEYIRYKNKKNKIIFYLSHRIKYNFTKQLNLKNISIKYVTSFNNFISSLKKKKIQFLVLDQQKIHFTKQKIIKNCVKFFVLIQDLPKNNYCDLIINQNFFTKKDYKGLVKNSKTELLIGPNYFIRKIFVNRKINTSRFNINIFFSGSTPYKLLNNFLKAIIQTKKDKIKINCFVGVNFAKLKNLRKTFLNTQEIKFFKNQPEKIFLKNLSNSSLAIGSAGVTVFERLYFRIPSIVVSLAKNQEKNAKFLKEKKAIIYLGSSNKVEFNQIKNALKNILFNQSFYLKLKKNTTRTADNLFKKNTSDIVYNHLRSLTN